MVTAWRAEGGQSGSASSSAASNLPRSWRTGQGIWVTETIRPSSSCASLRLAPPRSQPMIAVMRWYFPGRLSTKIEVFIAQSRKPTLVMPGLGPGIHDFGRPLQEVVDGRDKPGHDKTPIALEPHEQIHRHP